MPPTEPKAAKAARARESLDAIDTAAPAAPLEASAELQEPDPPAVDLAAMDMPSDLLSAAEIESARAEARKQWQERQKKAARAKIIETELRTLERERGSVLLGGNKDDIVTVRLQLDGPGGGGTGGPFDGAIIDGMRYQNGQLVTGPRHFVDSLLEMMWRSQMAQHNLDGKLLADFYAKHQPIEVTKGGVAQANPAEVIGI